MASHSSSSSSAPPPLIGNDVPLDQLENLKNLLKYPLTGRPLMVPLTSKAFVKGRLQPTISSMTTVPDGSHQVEEEEQVWLHTHPYRKKLLTRTEVSKLIEEAIHQRKPKLTPSNPSPSKEKTLPSSQPTTTKPSPSILKPAKIKNLLSSSSSNSNHQEFDLLPMFDIREEYTNDGKQVNAEAIDITQQLKVLQQQIEGGVEESKSEADSAPPVSTATEKYREDDDDDPDASRPLPSDDEYLALLARLDELARLEEEAERQGGTISDLHKKLRGTSPRVAATSKPSTNDSSKNSASGGGWATGFLNKSKTETKTTGTSKQLAKTEQENIQDVSSTSLPSDTVKVAASKETVTEVRKVRFQDSNTDVSERPQQYHPPQSTVSIPKPAPQVPKPLPNQIFTGVIRERTLTPPVTNEPPSTTTAKPQSSTVEPTKTKKLSRFALQRQQQQQGE